MSEPHRRRTLVACIRFTVIILLTVTALTAILLYAVFGRSTSETPMPIDDHDKSQPMEKKRVMFVEQMKPENRSAEEYLLPNRRSMNVRPWSSTRTRMPLTDGSIYDMSVSRNRYPNNHRYDSSDDSLVLDTQQNINRQKNHFDYSNLETDNWTTEKYDPTGYHNSYDSTYTMVDDYGNKHTNSIPGKNELNINHGEELYPYYSTIYGPYNKRPLGSQPIIDHQPQSVNYKLPSNSYQPQSPNYQLLNMNYEPVKITLPQNPILPDHQQKIAVPLLNTSVLDWRLVALFSLIKLGIVKIKSVAIIKILLFLLFNLKLLLIIIFFKFLLLLKLFKVVVLSLFLVPQLLTALTFPMVLLVLISIPGRIIRLLTPPNNSNSASTTTSNLPNNMVPSLPSIIRPNLPSRPSIPNPSAIVGPQGPSAILRPSNAPGSGTSFARALGQLLPINNKTSSTKIYIVRSPYTWHPKSLKAPYPVMDVFEKFRKNV